MFKGIIRKTAEKDNFVQGCIGNYADFGCIQEFADQEKIETLLKIFADFLGKKVEDITFCDGLNEFRISIMENDDGCEASSKELEDWKSEKIDLWAADYYLNVKEVIEVDQKKLEAAFNNLKGK